MTSGLSGTDPGPSAPAFAVRDGYAIPMGVFSLLRPGGRFVQGLVFALARRGAPPAAIVQLASIHFARVGVIRRFPDHDQPRDHLRQPLQLFESNYNGSFGSYVDSFVQQVPGKMRQLWGTSYGFPWCLPATPFKRYITASGLPIEHYYVRNPDVTVKIVSSSLRIIQATEQFRADAPGLDAEEFTARLRALVTEIQADL